MGEGATTAVSIPRSSAAAGASSSIRFLGLLKQPESPDPYSHSVSVSALELDESDVVWSSYSSSDDRSYPSSDDLSPVVTSPFPHQRNALPFIPATFGLSALLEPSSTPNGNGLIWPRQASPATPTVSVPLARSTPSTPYNQSAPVAVPVWPGRRKEGRKGRVEALDEIWGSEEGEEEDGKVIGNEDEIGDDEMEEIVPPHVIVARSHITSFSVLEGVGRTLKGRDLRRVRNAHNKFPFFFFRFFGFLLVFLFIVFYFCSELCCFVNFVWWFFFWVWLFWWRVKIFSA
ncbi:hypothetical protein LUZ60_016400 [Juncus effusus]|nr:hypothetical protein LUZ60_016400 [Juncus effusus]